MLWTGNNKPSLTVQSDSSTVLWQKLSVSARALQDSCSALTYRFDRVLATYRESQYEEAIDIAKPSLVKTNLSSDAVYV